MKLKPYPEYKDSGVPWLGKIPVHWQVRRNGQLFTQRNETGFAELPILEVSLRTGVRIRDFDNGQRKQLMFDRAKYKRAVRGDIAYNMMRMWQGAIGVAPVDGLISPAYVVARPYSEVDRRYCAYLFRTNAYMNEVNKYSHGIVSDRNRLYWDEFKQMPSIFPPTEEQKAIANYLDRHDRYVRRIIRNKQRLIDLLNEQKQSIIHCAVTRGLDPRGLLFQFGRCLAHFAVDDQEVRFCTHLKGKDSWFLPFNKGYNDGAGNPPNSNGLKTDYLWREMLTREGLTDILENYAQVVEEKNQKAGKKREVQIFPRYHQLDVVRKLLTDTRTYSAGRRYLIQHSAGSGKSNSIAWLAHPKKHDTFVLDFQNDADTIRQAFDNYYRTTMLSAETDPNKLHDLKAALDGAQVYDDTTVSQLVERYLGGADRDQLDPLLDSCVATYIDTLDEDGQVDFKGKAKAFVRTYSFLASVLPFSDNAAFKKWLADTIFSVTYNPPAT